MLNAVFALPANAFPTYDAAFMTARASPRQPNLREKSQLMSASEIERTLVRLALRRQIPAKAQMTSTRIARETLDFGKQSQPRRANSAPS